jgi:hypothetical protein
MRLACNRCKKDLCRLVVMVWVRLGQVGGGIHGRAAECEPAW